MPERLLVVANRLPLTVRRVGGRWRAEVSSGGLVAALAPVVEGMDGRWIGWPGEAPAVDAAGRAEVLREMERERGMVSVDLPSSVSRGFYEGFSNNALWPLLHGLPSRVTHDPSSFEAYRAANERFAETVVDRMLPEDLVWVQDYQLLLVPEAIRARRRDARIGLFLHVPFPPAETFRILPQREALLRGMLAADSIGFQTHEHLGAFRRTLLTVLGIESRMDRVEVDGRTVHLAARPIGIAPETWEQLTTTDRGVTARIAELRSRLVDRQMVIAVDRLDYTKGIPERLRAFRRLFERHPERRGRLTLVQVAVPSREGVPRYAQLRREVNELVGEINGELGTADWTPVVYLRRSVPRSELAALYAAADVAWVGSLRDGMNLVAKEYIASQSVRNGVLLLSEFAGAAGEMGEAVRINPYDELGCADALIRALDMPEAERVERETALLARVRANSALAWAERSVADLRTAVEERVAHPALVPSPSVDVLAARLRAAPRRVCYLDYDGTLVPIAPRPADAAPPRAVVDLLEALGRSPGTTVALLSGRSRRDLERWFGSTEHVWLAAEHGAQVRPVGSREWLPLHAGASGDWKQRVRPLLEHFAGRAPGSLIEDKDFALAWHYRLVEPEFGEWLANELAAALDQQVAGTDLAVLRGRKVVEVRFAWATKGEVAAWLRASLEPGALELAVGDDRTDEELFRALGDEAMTIRVGPGPTRAAYRLGGPADVLELLRMTVAPAAPLAIPRAVAAPAPPGAARTAAGRGNGHNGTPRRAVPEAPVEEPTPG